MNIHVRKRGFCLEKHKLQKSVSPLKPALVLLATLATDEAESQICLLEPGQPGRATLPVLKVGGKKHTS